MRHIKNVDLSWSINMGKIKQILIDIEEDAMILSEQGIVTLEEALRGKV